MMMAAIQPTPASFIAHLLQKKALVAREQFVSDEWPTIDLYQVQAAERRARCTYPATALVRSSWAVVLRGCLARVSWADV
jgi:hypothetical protein